MLAFIKGRELKKSQQMSFEQCAQQHIVAKYFGRSYIWLQPFLVCSILIILKGYLFVFLQSFQSVQIHKCRLLFATVQPLNCYLFSSDQSSFVYGYFRKNWQFFPPLLQLNFAFLIEKLYFILQPHLLSCGTSVVGSPAISGE